MAVIDGSRIDLNLLLALDALLTDRHVTQAARRLDVTQSTMSHSLSRLREIFHDALLVRSGRAMILTPRAEALAVPLRQALSDLDRLVRDEGAFDPSRSNRVFKLVCPDLLAPFLPALLNALSREAPDIRLEIAIPGPDLASALVSGTYDVALMPAPPDGAGLMQRSLGFVRWCIVARKGHPAVRKRLTRDAWLSQPHVMVCTTGNPVSLVDQTLRTLGVERTIGVRVPGFLMALHTVSATELFFAAPYELVSPVAVTLGLELHDPPVTLPAVPIVQLWHERFHRDPGHTWLRTLVADTLLKLLNARATVRAGPRRTTRKAHAPSTRGTRSA